MRALVITLTIIGALGLLFIVAYGPTKSRTHTLNCEGNLATLATCLHKYHDKYGHFPPAYLTNKEGQPKHSWRVLLLEFIDPVLFKKYDFTKSWNDPANKQLEHKMPSCFACGNSGGQGKWLTTYVVVVGNDTVFPGEKGISLNQISEPASTILVCETTTTQIHWMEPRDFLADKMSYVLNDRSEMSISSRDLYGPGVVFCDSTVSRLPASTSPDVLRRMIKRSKD